MSYRQTPQFAEPLPERSLLLSALPQTAPKNAVSLQPAFRECGLQERAWLTGNAWLPVPSAGQALRE